ncbi:MAG: class IV adenylate cyclase [Candidatus Thermoplasmatota archaeon]|nr:class IV adenylate cyclase [Candidatus Thermoplasmatota archaeon]
MGEKRLLELKARLRDPVQAAAWCTRHATFVSDVRQEDTYLRVGKGRLKLRNVEGKDEGTLIYYQREDRPDPKRSRVSLLPVADATGLLGLLRKALGLLVEVRKRRRIFRWGEVQVHLDEVDGLGTVLEFERVIDSHEEAVRAESEFAELRSSLRIFEKDLVAGSYSDMVLELDAQEERV